MGTPDLTDGYYQFDEVPNFCGYPETVVFAPALPAWITHNVASSDFTIPLNGDLSLIGQYTYNIQSTITVPDDYKDTTSTTYTVDYDFIVTVEPCVVNSFEDTQTAANIEYFLGTPTLANVSPYEFTQTQDCQYPETVTLTNLPAFLNHDAALEDFTLPINYDLSLIG